MSSGDELIVCFDAFSRNVVQLMMKYECLFIRMLLAESLGNKVPKLRNFERLDILFFDSSDGIKAGLHSDMF
jgi:hypothetical protein